MKKFGDPFIFMPQFKLCLVCGQIPKIPEDNVVLEHLKVTPFKSQIFVPPALSIVGRSEHPIMSTCLESFFIIL